MQHTLNRYAILLTLALLATLLILALPGTAHASSSSPFQTIPGWLEEALAGLVTALVKTLQDTARAGGVLLWGILKVCGLVGLFGADFTALSGTVVTEALNAVITGSVTPPRTLDPGVRLSGHRPRYQPNVVQLTGPPIRGRLCTVSSIDNNCYQYWAVVLRYKWNRL